jgi:hypothetical protein
MPARSCSQAKPRRATKCRKADEESYVIAAAYNFQSAAWVTASRKTCIAGDSLTLSVSVCDHGAEP